MPLLHRTLICFFFVFMALLCQETNAASLSDRLLSCNFNKFKNAPPANSFELDGVNDIVVNPAMMRDKVIILNFWKIDCAACSMEKPILERLARKYSDRGLEVIAVNLFDRPSDILDYIKKTDYPFTYCYDSHQRYTVNQKRLPSGTPTTFVVNAELEAIYEIPGLPTTYVIDRSGRVVGYSVGLVNWDNNILTGFVESLLGPPLTTVASSVDIPFSSDAKQGTTMPSGPTRNGPRKSVTDENPILSIPQTPPILEAPTRVPTTGPTLPFQTTDQPRPTIGPDDKSDHQSDENMTAKSRKSVKNKTKTKTKSEKSGSTRSTAEYAKPKPFSPATQRNVGVTDYPVHSNKPDSAKPASSIPSVGPSQTKDKGLPPLPAAMPYSPPNKASGSAILRPDETGSVMARMPGSNAPTAIGRGADNLPAAQPLGPGNSIGTSIMDSFGKPVGSTPPGHSRDIPQTGLTPPSTIFGQFTQDLQNLGAGVRDTFSSIIPMGK